MRLLIFLSLIFTISNVQAQPFVETYRGMIEGGIYNYFRSLKQADYESFSIQNLECTDEYAEILQKKEMRIHYAFGYFDESNGRMEDGTYSRAIDNIAFAETSKWLTRSCHPSEGHALCGFTKRVIADGYHHYSKDIVLLGEAVKVNLYMTQAAATSVHLANTGASKSTQQQLTDQSEYNFFEGIKKADIVIYNGHARDGGGPDFKPPVLRSDLHPDYNGHYQVKQEGFKKMLEALKERPHRNQVLGIFACYTDKHFTEDIQKVQPDQRLIVSRSKPDFFTATKTSLGYLDGFLEGLCADSIGVRARSASVIAQREYIDVNF